RRLRDLRLRALAEAPLAFGTTLDEASSWPVAHWVNQLDKLPTFVAVVDGADAGIVRCAAGRSRKSMLLISLWVDPLVRRQGVARSLIQTVVGWARAARAERLVLNVAED